MSPVLRRAYKEELRESRRLAAAGDMAKSFARLERAHVLGQRNTRAHVRVHWEMLRIGWRRKGSRELAGQIFRILGALVLSYVWVPVGNTGGANVSAFASMPIPEDLRRLLDA